LLSSSKTFDILRYLERETEHLPWKTFLNQINFYLELFESTDAYGDLEFFLRNLITPIYNKLGWKSDKNVDSWSDRKLRNIVLGFACKVGVKDCVDKSIALYRDLMKDYIKNEWVFTR
jgi:aminopeptidase N